MLLFAFSTITLSLKGLFAILLFAISTLIYSLKKLHIRGVYGWITTIYIFYLELPNDFSAEIWYD